MLLLEAKTDIFARSTPAAVLDITPGAGLAHRLQGAPNVSYLRSDSAGRTGMRFDLVHLPFRTGSVDGVICLHVLEHITEDRAALQELRRVTKPEGWALFGAPVETSLLATFEDVGVIDAEERARLFGRSDRVRIYARKDFLERLRLSGWDVAASAADALTQNQRSLHGLFNDPDRDLVVYCQPAAPSPSQTGPPNHSSSRDRGITGISVVMPAYNEALNIEVAVAGAINAAESCSLDFEIIVVNDGSDDGTGRIVGDIVSRNPRVRLLGWEQNRGYGAAVSAGLKAATKDLVLFTDADNQFDLSELATILPIFAEPEIAVVCGYRKNRQDRLVRRLNAGGWNALVRLMFYVPVRDIDCAFKLFRREALRDLDIDSVGAMVNTELMVKLGRSGVGVVEVPVSHYPRTAGEARGANLGVIVRAFRELFAMRERLSAADATTRRADLTRDRS